MKNYLKQHEVSYSNQRFNWWQALRTAWQKFATFMYDKADYSDYHNIEPRSREQRQGTPDPPVYPSSIEAERQWLEEIYRNS